jgi:hypothetical protein
VGLYNVESLPDMTRNVQQAAALLDESRDVVSIKFRPIVWKDPGRFSDAYMYEDEYEEVDRRFRETGFHPTEMTGQVGRTSIAGDNRHTGDKERQNARVWSLPGDATKLVLARHETGLEIAAVSYLATHIGAIAAVPALIAPELLKTTVATLLKLTIEAVWKSLSDKKHHQRYWNADEISVEVRVPGKSEQVTTVTVKGATPEDAARAAAAVVQAMQHRSPGPE